MAQGHAPCPFSPNTNNTEALLLAGEESSHFSLFRFEARFASYQPGYLWQVTNPSGRQVHHKMRLMMLEAVVLGLLPSAPGPFCHRI